MQNKKYTQRHRMTDRGTYRVRQEERGRETGCEVDR